MRSFFRTTFRGARGIALGFVLTLALGGVAYAVTTTATTTSDFSLSASVTSANTTPGGAVGYGINLAASGGFSDNVTLSTAGTLPPGVTATFGTNPSFVDASLASASTLWVNTSPASSSTPTPVGQYTINVVGTSSTGATHSMPVTLNVGSSGSPDYTIEMTPTTGYVSAGGNVTYNLHVVPANGFAGTVTLSAKSVPGSILMGWSPAAPTTAQNPSVSIPVDNGAPGTATLTVGTTSTNPPGSYALTITGTSGSISHTVAGTLDIDLFSATGSTSAPLFPGASAKPISVSLTDPYNYAVTITGLSASVAQDSQGRVINSSNQPVPGCLASWFKFTNTPLSSNNTLGLGAQTTMGLPSIDDPSISMIDAPVSQDNCEGVTLKLNFVGTAQK